MTPRQIDRPQLKAQTRELLRSAQVRPKAMAALYLGLIAVLNLADTLAGSVSLSLLGTFVTVLTMLLGTVLNVGFVLYCMAIRRGERAEFLTLFDGFSFVGKIIGLSILQSVFIFLWSLLFVIPGIIAAYRYRFAMYNLCENPDLSIVEALDMSKRQTEGYKGQLFVLDLSYLGWGILASVPSTVEFFHLYLQILEDPAVFMADPTRLVPLIGSGLLMSLIIWLWSLAVQLFYLPNYQCVELGYFDIAKETSGVGAGARPQEGGWSGWNGGQDGWGGGPDDLGGY